MLRLDDCLEIALGFQQFRGVLDNVIHHRSTVLFTVRESKVTRKRAFEEVFGLKTNSAEEKIGPHAESQIRPAGLRRFRIYFNVAVMSRIVESLNGGSYILRCNHIAGMDRNDLNVIRHITS